MQVFGHEKTLSGRSNLGDRREVAVWKYVLVDPGIRCGASLILAYRMQQEQAVVVKAAVRDFHKGPQIFPPNMLEHAHTGDTVKVFIYRAVIL